MHAYLQSSTLTILINSFIVGIHPFPGIVFMFYIETLYFNMKFHVLWTLVDPVKMHLFQHQYDMVQITS